MGRLGVKITRKFFSSQNVQLTVQNCGCEKLKLTISTLLAKYNCIEFQPCIYCEGWEWYRIFAFTDTDIRALFNELSKVGKAEVIMRATREGSTLRENLMVSVSNLFGELTKKQAEALVAALHHDYYSVPKKKTTDQIAAVLRMPRTTYEEHPGKPRARFYLP